MTYVSGQTTIPAQQLVRPTGVHPDVEVCFAQDAWINDDPLFSGVDPRLGSEQESASGPHRNGQAAGPRPS